MYKIEDGLIKDFVENTNNLTKVERDLFYFLVNGVPENILYISNQPQDPETPEEWVENKPFLILLLAMAKVLGGSRELILNLRNSHSLPNLIQNILDTDNLKDNNKRLLALMARDVGFDIDFTKITRDTEDKYLKELETYFNFILNYYTNVRNRGSTAALHQILRDYNQIDLNLGYPELDILDQGDYDELADELGLNGTGGKPDKLYVDSGRIRAHFTTLPESYALIPEDLSYETTFDFNNNLFYLNPDSKLYKLLMEIKPAGIYYELVVKATLYMLFTEDKVLSASGSSVSDGSDTDTGFRVPTNVNLITNTINFSYTDNIDEITDITASVGVMTNVDFDSFYSLEATTFTEEKNIDHDILKVKNQPKQTLHTYNIDFDLDNDVLFNGLDDVTSLMVRPTVKDKYDYSRKSSFSRVLPLNEIIKLAKLELSQVQENTYGVSTDLTATVKNSHNREKSTVVIEFLQNDYYGSGTITEFTDGSELMRAQYVKTFMKSNTSPKAKHGKLATRWTVTRDNKTKVFNKNLDVKWADKYGRQDFPLELNVVPATGTGINISVTNPNKFGVSSITLAIKYEYRNILNQWGIDHTANSRRYNFGAGNQATVEFNNINVFQDYKIVEYSGAANKEFSLTVTEHTAEEALINLSIANQPNYVGNILKNLFDNETVFATDDGISEEKWCVVESDPYYYDNNIDKPKRAVITVAVNSGAINGSEYAVDSVTTPTFITPEPVEVPTADPSINTIYCVYTGSSTEVAIYANITNNDSAAVNIYTDIGQLLGELGAGATTDFYIGDASYPGIGGPGSTTVSVYAISSGLSASQVVSKTSNLKVCNLQE